MRYMYLLKMSEDVGPPPQELVEAMGQGIEDMTKAGVMLDAGGLLPGPAGARVRLAAGEISVTDGPFTEAKELVGGYSILQVRSRDEAVEMGRRLIQIHKDHWPGWQGEVEIRQVADPDGA